MTFFKFCPSCKSTDFTFSNNVRFHCNDCDFTYYHNIAAAVAIVFTFEDKILFTVRNVDPDKGKWDLPGGFIDPGENAEAAACREIKEELNIDISRNCIAPLTFSEFDYNNFHLLLLLYVCRKCCCFNLRVWPRVLPEHC